MALQQHPQTFPHDRVIVRQQDANRFFTLPARQLHPQHASPCQPPNRSSNLPPRRSDPLLHADQPHPPLLQRIEALAIVVDREQQAAGLLLHRDLHIPRARRAARCCGAPPEPSDRCTSCAPPGRSSDTSLGRRPSPTRALRLRRFPSLPLQRGDKAQVVEHRGAQQQRHVAHYAASTSSISRLISSALSCGRLRSRGSAWRDSPSPAARR